jgi:hypothetical protein
MPSPADSTRTPERVQSLDQLEQVQQATTQPVQLGDQDDVDLAGGGRGEQLVQRRPRRCRPGHAGVDVLAGQRETMPPGQAAALVALGVNRSRVDLAFGRDPQIHRRTRATACQTRRTCRRTRTRTSTHGRHHQTPGAA